VINAVGEGFSNTLERSFASLYAVYSGHLDPFTILETDL
jgi:hypothetical protein